MIAIGIWIILPLAFIILNGVSIRRRSTNTLCALAIIFTLLGMIFLSLSGIGREATHIDLDLLVWLTRIGAGLLAVSCVLAIIGLVRFHQRRRFTRGRWRAVVALCLNGLILTLLYINSIDGIQETMAWNKLLQPTSIAGAVATNETWNFRIQPPPNWTQIDPGAFGSDFRAAFSRKRPEMYSLVSAQDFPDGVEVPLSEVMDAVKKIARANGKVEFLSEEEKTEHEFLARTLEMRTHELTKTKFHVFWIVSDGNTNYQITTWGSDSDAAAIREEARKMAEGFQLIEIRSTKPKKKPTVASLSVPTMRRSPFAM